MDDQQRGKPSPVEGIASFLAIVIVPCAVVFRSSEGIVFLPFLWFRGRIRAHARRGPPNISSMNTNLRAWHDYHLTGYSVDGERREIALKLVWPYELQTDIPKATVTFSGVEGYFLEDDLGENIVHGLEHWPAEQFLEAKASQFEQRSKQAGWPLFWRGSVRNTLAYLQAKSLNCIQITSSFGISGWIVAADVAHAPTSDET